MSDFLDACDKLREQHGGVEVDLTPCPDCGACPAELRCQCDFIGLRKQRELDAARAEAAMLREALEGIRDTSHCAYRDSGPPQEGQYQLGVADGHRCASGMAAVALSATSGDWLAKHDAEKDAEIARISAELTEQFSLLVRAKSQLHASEQEIVRLSAQLDEAHADSYRQTQLVTALEAERDGLAAVQADIKGRLRCEKHESLRHPLCSDCQILAKLEMAPAILVARDARIATDARRKALMEVAEAALEKYGASPTQHWLAKLAQR